MNFKKPIVAYTANGNLEVHSVVTWLESNGVPAYAVEDLSGLSLFQFGTISQFHKPQVFIEEYDSERAIGLLLQFEKQRDLRRKELEDAPPITAECEECGSSSEFPASQDGTTQNCPKCYAFMDVGTIEWPDGFQEGEAEPFSRSPDTIDDVVDAASKLDKAGDWDDAIKAYRKAVDRWPEHATYLGNCIAEVERKRDLAR